VVNKIFANRIPDPLPIGSYNPNDVIFLLKNLNGLLTETDLHTREKMSSLAVIIQKCFR